jgi:hypothetical protein
MDSHGKCEQSVAEISNLESVSACFVMVAKKVSMTEKEGLRVKQAKGEHDWDGSQEGEYDRGGRIESWTSKRWVWWGYKDRVLIKQKVSMMGGIQELRVEQAKSEHDIRQDNASSSFHMTSRLVHHLHAQEHVSVNCVNNKIITLDAMIFCQCCTMDDWVNWKKFGWDPQSLMNTPELKVFVFERALSNQSIIWVNESNWMSLTIHDTSEKHQ